MGLVDQQGPQGGGASAPMPQDSPAGGGGSPMGGMSVTPDMVKQLQEQLKSSMSGSEHLVPRRMDPKQTHVGLGKSMLGAAAAMFLPVVGSAIQQHLMLQKQAQVNEATNEFMALDNALEKAHQLAGGDEQKTQELWKQMPEYQAMFDPNNPAAKKRLKNFAKMFQVDWLNPEKAQNTVHYQGLQKFMKLRSASKLMDMMKGMLGKGPQDTGMSPQQAGDLGNKFAQQMPRQIQQPDPKVAEGLLNANARIQEQRQAHIDQMERFKEQLGFRKDMLQQQMEMRKQQFDENMEQKKLSADQMEKYRESMMDYHKQMLEFNKSRLKAEMEMRREQMQLRLEMKNERSQIPIALQSRLVQTEIIDEQIEHLKTMIKDPELQKWMGPVSGLGAQAMFARKWNPKIQEFKATVESLDALFAQVHGYRGGAHVHVIFQAATGDITFKPEAFAAGLDQYKVLNDNVRTGAKKHYPNDAFFRNEGSSGIGEDEPPPPGFEPDKPQ